MSLAILVVYFLPDERLPVLDLHLQAIGQRTRGDFVIYAAAPRVSAQVRQRLADCPHLRLVDVAPTTLVGSREHSHHLDELCDHAVAAGATRLCTMDVDAFPVVDGWNLELERELQAGHDLAAVFRAENDDTALPHPCCCYFPTDFWVRFRPSFYPDEAEMQSPGFQDFLRASGQKLDSGIGLGYALWQHQRPWKELRRSNEVDEHFLLAGIYGDLIFHLGAMSWTDRDFRKDRQASWLLRALDRLEAQLKSVGQFNGPARQLWFAINQRANKPLVARTNRIFDQALQRLADDPDAYIRHLRGR